ncbi:hypothetical protein BH10PAT1_BH10PAT1_6150 [soil metagenome]
MFNGARLKLTAWYLLIIMVISISFSAVIFKASASEVERFDRIQRSRIIVRLGIPPTPIQDPALIEETEQRIITTLVLINVGILVISGITGYVLAGITLTPIKEMVDEQNRFISDASHEINTPLTSLKTAMEVYLRSKKQTIDESKILVKESINEVNKLQALSQSLLQLAQYEKPNGHTKFEKISLKEIIENTIKKIEPLAKQKEIKIEIKIENIKIIGNIYGLTDLFVILLDNAVKYSPKNSKIEIKTTKIKDQVSISIKDNGIGISETDIPHVFDRFYRADEGRFKKGSGGYGLGLSIAKKIIDTHHGNIHVESVLNKGTTFTITLPR